MALLAQRLDRPYQAIGLARSVRIVTASAALHDRRMTDLFCEVILFMASET